MPQIYCSICGAPMGWEEEWLSESILLTTAYETAEGLRLDRYQQPTREDAYAYILGHGSSKDCVRNVLLLDAHTSNGTIFEICSTGERIIPMQIVWDSTSRDGLLYMPLHRSCLIIADQFMNILPPATLSTLTQSGIGITSRITLWEVLYRRLSGSFESSTWVLPEPHDYFGGIACRNVYYEPGDDVEFAKLHEAPPLEVCDIMNSILRNLKPIDSANQIRQPTLQRDPELNPDHLRNLELECNYIYTQSSWCLALCDRQTFPWLWDLDVEAIRAKQTEGNWNWELLVRELSQVRIHEPDYTSIEIPDGLRNRRRIWRILEEARVGDIEDVEEPRLVAAWARRYTGEED